MKRFRSSSSIGLPKGRNVRDLGACCTRTWERNSAEFLKVLIDGIRRAESP